MSNDKYKNQYRIKSARATWHDYGGGVYFVTICTKNHKHYFGEIQNVGTRHTTSSLQQTPINEMYTIANMQGWLSVVIGGVKSAVTKFARNNKIDFAWQSRFHDHIIGNQDEMNTIANYIENNPELWDSDCFNEQRKDAARHVSTNENEQRKDAARHVSTNEM